MSSDYMQQLKKLLISAVSQGDPEEGDEGLGSTPVLAVVESLAEVDPGTAVSWLADHANSLKKTLDKNDLAKTLHQVVQSSLEYDAEELSGDLHFLLKQFDSLALPRTIAMMVQATQGTATASSQDRLSLVRSALKKEPKNVRLLRTSVELAAEIEEANTVHNLLDRLGRSDPTPATLRYVRKKREELPPMGAPEVRVAFLSSFSVDPLADFVDLECREIGLRPETYVAPFDSWTEEVIASNSGLREFRPEIAFLFVSIDDLMPELADDPPFKKLREAGRSAVERIGMVAERFTTWSDALLVVGGFYSVHEDPAGIYRGRSRPSRSQWLSKLNRELFDKLSDIPRTYFLDLKDAIFRRPDGALDNPKMRHLGSVRFGPGILPTVADSCARYVAPVKGLTRKCVVVDLDNTLWGGIVGEDGLHGVKIGNTSPGSEYRDFQRFLKILTNRGIILAVNSKNNPDDALQVFRERDEMVLTTQDFAAMRINWKPKPENMQSLAEELNIGLDSMVFLDDNPHERDMMRQLLPEVLTPELPRDPARYRSTVEQVPHLEKLVVTDEDRMRVQQYHARKEREEFRESSVSLEDYLHSLDIRIEIDQANEATLPRIHQLVQRTNQFNLTTRRYDMAELRAFSESPETRLYTLRSRDRYGDHGLVCTSVVHIDGARWTIDSFMMSCRVIGHGIEDAMLAAISEDALAAGASVLLGEFIETKKNKPASEFYRGHGFSKTEIQAPEDETQVTHWELSLEDGAVEFPDWIETERETANVS